MKLQTEITHLKTVALHPSPWNRDGNGDDKEFLNSIRQNGILNPIIVRKRPEGGYEIVAGHRRHHAAMALKLPTIPSIVKELTDSEAIQVQIIENLQRKNLTPMEEAHAFEQLAKIHGYKADAIAKLVDRSEKYVTRALALLKLPAAAVKAIESGKLSAAHGHQLLRVGPKQIDTMVKFATVPGWKGDMPTVTELEREIDTKAAKDLASAAFPKDKEYAGKIPCTGCEFNTGNQDVLFDGAESGHCTNGPCFNAKNAQYDKDLESAGAKKYPGLKFIGAARTSWNDPQQIKGWMQVEEKLPKVKKALADHPDKFGYGILKPSGYGKTKKPTLILLTSDPKIAGVKERADTSMNSYPQSKPASLADQAKAQFVERMSETAVAHALMGADLTRDIKETMVILTWRNTGWNREALAPYFSAVDLIVDKDMDDKAIGDALGKLSQANLDKLLFWILVVTNENNDSNLIDAIAEANEIDLDKARRDGVIAGEKQWENVGEGIVAELEAKKAEKVPS